MKKEDAFGKWLKEYGWFLIKEAEDDKEMLDLIAKLTKKDLKTFRPYLWKAFEAGVAHAKSQAYHALLRDAHEH